MAYETLDVALSRMAELIDYIKQADVARQELAELRQKWAPEIAILTGAEPAPAKKRRGRPPKEKAHGDRGFKYHNGPTDGATTS